MPTNAMLSAGHMGIVDALKYGATRNDATLAAALGAIGATEQILLLPYEGDGIWTLNSAWTIPANVILWIPPGVHIAGSGNGTVNGKIRAETATWYTGTGTVTLNLQPSYFGHMIGWRLGLNVNFPATQIHMSGDNVLPAQIRIEERTAGAGGATLTFFSANVQRGIIGLGAGTQDITVSLQNSARFIVANGLMGIGMAPNFQLQLNSADAYKSAGTTWQNPSDPRLKADLEPFTDGLDLLQQVEPISYRLNGRGGLVDDETRHVGVDAAALQAVAPALVGSYRGALDPDGDETDILTFRGGDQLLFALVNAVKELAARMDALEGSAQRSPAEAHPPRRRRPARHPEKTGSDN